MFLVKQILEREQMRSSPRTPQNWKIANETKIRRDLKKPNRIYISFFNWLTIKREREIDEEAKKF